jgi:hypothetical protein
MMMSKPQEPQVIALVHIPGETSLMMMMMMMMMMMTQQGTGYSSFCEARWCSAAGGAPHQTTPAC